MNARRVEVTFSQKDWDRLERARGHEPRASFVKRALEFFLSDPVTDLMPRPNRALEPALGGVEESEHQSLDHSVSAPVRAPVYANQDVEAWPGHDPVRAPVVESDAFAAGEVMDRASAFRAATGRKK